MQTQQLVKNEFFVPVEEISRMRPSIKDNYFTDKAIQMENETILKVLENHLGRKPTAEDALMCAKFYPKGERSFYAFAYKGQKLGTMIISISLSYICFTFEPAIA